MRVSFVKNKKSYIDICEMTRNCEKLKAKYILVNNMERFNNVKELKKWIKSLRYQDNIYFSCHYIIDKFGKIYNIIPINEVAYHTKNIKINNESIGIVVMSNKGKFSSIQKKSLKSLLKKHRKIPAYIYPKIICSKNMSYYTTHPTELVL